MESIGSITLNISLDRFQTCSFSTHGCDRSPCHQHQQKHLGNSYQPLGNTWSLQRYVQSDQSMDATWTNKVNIRVQFSAVVVQPSQSCETLSRRQMALNASLYTMKPKASKYDKDPQILQRSFRNGCSHCLFEGIYWRWSATLDANLLWLDIVMPKNDAVGTPGAYNCKIMSEMRKPAKCSLHV